MTSPVRLTKIAESYATGTNVYSQPRSLSDNQIEDTVQISQEAYEKSREYLAQINEESSPDQSLSESQTGNNLEILNLTPDATKDQIRKAYLGAIKLYHPDNFAGSPPEFRQLAEEKSKQINLAYKKLTGA